MLLLWAEECERFPPLIKRCRIWTLAYASAAFQYLSRYRAPVGVTWRARRGLSLARAGGQAGGDNPGSGDLAADPGQRPDGLQDQATFIRRSRVAHPILHLSTRSARQPGGMSPRARTSP